MGAWGVKLYQNDFALDIKTEYLDKIRNGIPNEEVTNELLLKYQNIIDDIDDGMNFWFVLANEQWKIGRLLPIVKKKALGYIENGADLKIWYLESKKLGDARKKVLEDLREKLNSSQPSEKKMYQKRYYICPWKIGDVFALKMESDLAKENNLHGKYIIFQKIEDRLEGSMFNEQGHVSPIVRCWISDIAEYSVDMNKRTECILTHPIISTTYKFNYSYLIYTTSKRVVPKKILYLGNYDLYVPSNDSLRIIQDAEIVMWPYFEEKIIHNYLNFT